MNLNVLKSKSEIYRILDASLFIESKVNYRFNMEVDVYFFVIKFNISLNFYKYFLSEKHF